MAGETNLEALLANMQPVLAKPTYVFCTVDAWPESLALEDVWMTCQEDEGRTFILTRARAEALGLAYEMPSRRITLNVHSALEAVGFLAAIVPKLAALGMGVNPVAGFHHDHLFVPVGREQEALAALAQISDQARARF